MPSFAASGCWIDVAFDFILSVICITVYMHEWTGAYMISVIIPVYNTEKYIDRCIESIVNQSETDLEIILVDDCSKDGSKDKLKAWEEKDSRIKVIYKTENEGVSAARNDGILLSRGDYIAFVDSDDNIEAGYFKALLYHIENTDADIAFGRFQRIYANQIDKMKPKQESGVLLDLNEAVKYCLPQMEKSWFDCYIWDKLFRRNVIFLEDKVVLFDRSIHFTEDSLWLICVLMNMNKAVIVNEAVYCYDCTRNSSAHHAVYDQGNTLLAKDAVLSYELIYEQMRAMNLSCAENALQRKIIYQKLTCRGAVSAGNQDLFTEMGKSYIGNLRRWVFRERSVYGFIWAIKQLGAFYTEWIRLNLRASAK